jgi:hypothetical protein
MVTPEGQALGVIDAWTWTRKAKGEDDIKESHRWIEGYGIVADRAQSQPNTRFVTVADRKADIQELMEEARRRDYAADYLIRAKHNRNLVGGEKLWDSIASQEPLIHTRSHPAAQSPQSMSNPVRPTGDSAQEKVIASSAKTLWEGMEKIWHYGIEIEIARAVYANSD